jgi:hypothetical protein
LRASDKGCVLITSRYSSQEAFARISPYRPNDRVLVYVPNDILFHVTSVPYPNNCCSYLDNLVSG